MNNIIKGLFTLTLLASATAHASYIMYIPTEVKLRGSLPDGSIQFVSATEEPTTPEEPTEPVIVWNVELIKKTKYYQHNQYRYKETFNDSNFNIIAGGFDHVVSKGKSGITYKFSGYTNEQYGYEFIDFELPTKLVVESGGVSLNCTGSVGLNIPFTGQPAMYTAGWSCDGILPNLVQNRPDAMKLRFTFK
ncbi:hypothetical protein IGB31_00135 [Pseudomonas putida]|nr:hypothetical protein IGB31_00135 [Pseudomonas putida]